ncbi:MAG: LysM peptidoglycan-binding domain-containing protein [Rhodothermales bacterium]|nr:LysM peptidoglycan-binding domain-containing protein [Rhodothermales bacterium]MBO6778208.1 LysM peptidoglycan-binding domain-containing protein [Rhodothermales bacterium]
MLNARVTGALAPRMLLVILLMAVAGQATAQVKRTYTVRAGDTLYRIALNHNMSVEELQRLNGMDGTIIKVGQVLRLTDGSDLTEEVPPAAEPPAEVAPPVEAEVVEEPPPVGVESAVTDPPAEDVAIDAPAVQTPEFETESLPAFPEPPPPAPITAVTDSSGAVLFGEYTLAAGQSYYDIAFTLGVSVDTLEALNPDQPAVVASGDVVRVPARYASSTHTVASGETLYGIAASHGVALSELRLANPDLGDVLLVGQDIRVPRAPAEITMPLVVAQGPASIYPQQFVGRLMASGRPYEDDRFTLAHPALPFGTVVLIENAETGQSTFAEVADRMPVSTDFVVEVSRAVAEAIGLGEAGVSVRIIESGGQ